MCLLFNGKLSYDEGVLTAYTAETCGAFNGTQCRCIPVWTHTYILHGCLCEI